MLYNGTYPAYLIFGNLANSLIDSNNFLILQGSM